MIKPAMGLIIFLAISIAIGWLIARLVGTKSQKSKDNRMPGKMQKTIYKGKAIYYKEVHDEIETKTSVSEQAEPREYQPWLTRAVEHKQSKEFDKALECLDEAYKACADYDIDTVFDHYLRLPYYLQLAGRADEGWEKLNEFNLGLLPYRGDAPTGSERSVRLRQKVARKMVVFLNREKRFKDSLVHITIAEYLSNSIMAEMVNDGWIGEESVKRGMDNMRVNFEESVKKAGLSTGLAEKLNTLVEEEVNEKTDELYVLSRVPDLMMQARWLISESS